jgi:hypothetical protein
VTDREPVEWDGPGGDEAFGEVDEAPTLLRPAPKPEEPGELALILAGSAITPAWLDGYFMAVLVAPKMVRPGGWIGELMQVGPVLPDVVAAQRYLDLMTARSNATVADLDEPERLKARVAGIATEDLADWARGFSRMVRRFGSAWRDKSVGKEDKAMLSLIEAVGRGEKPGEIRPLLAQWLGNRRAAIR